MISKDMYSALKNIPANPEHTTYNNIVALKIMDEEKLFQILSDAKYHTYDYINATVLGSSFSKS